MDRKGEGMGIAEAADIDALGDASCIICGYQLRGLSAKGVCPECGTKVSLSLLLVWNEGGRVCAALTREPPFKVTMPERCSACNAPGERRLSKSQRKLAPGRGLVIFLVFLVLVCFNAFIAWMSLFFLFFAMTTPVRLEYSLCEACYRPARRRQVAVAVLAVAAVFVGLPMANLSISPGMVGGSTVQWLVLVILGLFGWLVSEAIRPGARIRLASHAPGRVEYRGFGKPFRQSLQEVTKPQ